MKDLPNLKNKKVMFTGITRFWFTSIIKDAENNLVEGRMYVVNDIKQYSSWTSIKLQGFEQYVFPLGWFEVLEESNVEYTPTVTNGWLKRLMKNI